MVESKTGSESVMNAPRMVIFNTCTPQKLTVTSWENGPQKQTGIVKRGRPRKEQKKLQIAERLEASDFEFINYIDAPKKHGAQLKRAVKSRAMLNYRKREREQKRGNKGNLLSLIDTMTSMILLPEISVGDLSNTGIKMEQYMVERLVSYSTSIYELIYSLERYADYNPVTETWLPMAFRDAALLHCLIFCADSYRQLSESRAERPEAVIHLKKVIEIVNERLTAPVPNITDGTIVVVCTLAHSEKVKGNVENWKIHMNGLKQMVELRGGIQAFDSKRMVRNKIHRADLSGSIDLVQKPVFEFHRDSPTISGHHSGEIKGIRNTVTIDLRLDKIIRQLHEITLNVNLLHLKTTDIHPLSLREDITSLQYALLCFDFNSNDEALHLVNRVAQLGHLVYLVTILDEGFPGTSTCDNLVQILASYLKRLPPGILFTDEFLLWISFCAASTASEGQIQTDLQILANGYKKGLSIFSWDDAEVIFKSFFWVDKIHGITFRRVWKALEGMKCQIPRANPALII